MIDGETGLLVGPDDGDGMGRAIESLVRDAATRERLGQPSRDRVMRDFQPVDVTRAIVDQVIGA